MPSLSTFFSLALALVAFSTAGTAQAAPRSGAMEIRVEAGNWGNARPRDIEAVLGTVADTLISSFPQHGGERVSIAYSAAGPSVLLGRTADGAHRVFLKVQDARWDQFAYQFSHELCHIFTNHEHREAAPGVVARDHQWFEETICEAVSLLTLERMGSRWEQSPPHPGWQSYAPAFLEYAQELLSEEHRRLPPDETLSGWFAANQATLEGNPYLRQKNELLAAYLLSLFKNVPGSLEAIGYLNSESAVPATFTDYLASWYSCCPGKERTFVVKVKGLLGGDSRRPAAPPPA